MSRCLSMVSTAIMSIVCVCVVGGCALQGDQQDDPPASDPVTQDLSTHSSSHTFSHSLPTISGKFSLAEYSISGITRK